MSEVPTQNHTHPDELLPWFVNNTLSETERTEVDTHVQTCTRCQQEVAFLHNMRTRVKENPIQSPGVFGLNRLLKEVQRDNEMERLQRQQQSGWWRTSLAIAASLIILIQAGLLIDAWFFSKPMVPLSGPEEQGIVLQLSFEPTAMEVDIRESVSAVGGTFIDGPGQLGVYRIRLNLSPTDEKGVFRAHISSIKTFSK